MTLDQLSFGTHLIVCKIILPSDSTGLSSEGLNTSLFLQEVVLPRPGFLNIQSGLYVAARVRQNSLRTCDTDATSELLLLQARNIIGD